MASIRQCVAWSLSLIVFASAQAWAAAAPAGAGLPGVARPALGDRAARVVQSGPSALAPEARREQGRYLISLAGSMLGRSEPSSWAMAALMLQEQRDAIGLAMPGGEVVMADGHAVDDAAIEGAFRRARSEGMSDAATLAVLSATTVPGLFQTSTPEFAQRQVEVDATNAFAWLRTLFRNDDVAPGKQRHVLQRAAAAVRYDDHHGHVVRLFLAASERLPPPSLKQDDGALRSPETTRLMLADYFGRRYETDTGVGHVPLVCTRPEQDAAMRASCRTTLRKLVARPTTYRALDSALQALALGATETDHVELEQQQRASRWQVQKLHELGFVVTDDPVEVAATLADWTRGGSEVSVGRARLRRHRIALDPPVLWQAQAPALVPLRQ